MASNYIYRASQTSSGTYNGVSWLGTNNVITNTVVRANSGTKVGNAIRLPVGANNNVVDGGSCPAAHFSGGGAVG